ncbi:hypothetical protein Patl1_32508 [Pistacia atlantica]|uniref:Uncharacterized protein n=1 Tax=Pistacia atlantica TaxID=434234 RepID=A0ACC1AMQ3_9ROSI|nr:hypothetical protein Patl1_32508 [Pistacia atlantica]
MMMRLSFLMLKLLSNGVP